MKIQSISNFFLLLLLILIPISLTVAETEEQISIVKVDSSAYNFESVLEGTKVSTTFNIGNTGNAPLNIINFIPSCGCLVTKLPSQSVLPGETVPVTVEFDTLGFAGKQEQQVAINTDNLQQKQLVFSLNGVVEPEVSISPNKIFQAPISAENLANLPETKFQVIVNSKSKATITDLIDLSQLVEVNNLKLSPKKATFSAKYLRPEKPGLYRDRLSINLKDASRKNYNIPVFVKVQEFLEIIPPALSFGLLKDNKKMAKKLKLQFPKEMGLEITEINSENPAITAVLEPELSKENLISLRVTIDPVQVKENILTDLVLSTNNQEYPEIRVNVFATVPPRLEE